MSAPTFEPVRHGAYGDLLSVASLLYRSGADGAIWAEVEGEPGELLFDWCPEIIQTMDTWGGAREAVVRAWGQSERVRWPEVLDGSMWRRFDLTFSQAEADVLGSVIGLEMVRCSNHLCFGEWLATQDGAS